MKSTTFINLMEFYRTSSYDEQVRVSFVYNFIKNMIFLLIPLIIYTYWIQSTSTSIVAAILPISLEIFTLIIYIFLLKQIKKGYFIITAHIALILAFLINWIIMFQSQTDIIMRFSSASYILALLTITPIFVIKRVQIIIYSCVNIIIVIIFGVYSYLFYDISKFYFYDFISDYVLSIIILTFALVTTKKIYETLMDKSSEEIRKRELAEDALKKVNQELEKTVDERTKELSEALEKLETSNLELNFLNNNLIIESQKLIELNDKLAQKEIELSRSNITKEKILQIISHEIRTPLQSFLMNSEILKIHSHRMSPEEIESVNDNMIKSIHELHNLFEDLMSFSNVKLSNFKPQQATFKLHDLVNSILYIFKPSLESKQIVLTNQIPQDIQITTDQSLLNSIMISIISNSIKFGKNNGKIIISYEEDKDNSIIYIEDDGIGIRKENLEQIIAKYKISKNKDEVIWDGSLSGLSLSLNLIEELGGTLDIESEKENGTKVIIKLPKK